MHLVAATSAPAGSLLMEGLHFDSGALSPQKATLLFKSLCNLLLADCQVLLCLPWSPVHDGGDNTLTGRVSICCGTFWKNPAGV